ncbi:MAG: DUF92 domain-containing protein [Terracidiphilus sp.]
MAQINLQWQSKVVLLLVLPATGAEIVLQTQWCVSHDWQVALWTLGMSLIFASVVLKLRAATPMAALAGAAITACLIFSTMIYWPTAGLPFAPWHTALMPILAVVGLTLLSTRLGRMHKEMLGTAERRQGRTAAQVAANLGVAAMASSFFVQLWLIDTHWFSTSGLAPIPIFAPVLAALAEAGADTVSSEIGQVLGRRPRMMTTLRRVEPGTNGGISLVGTLAGVAAAAMIAAVGAWALGGGVEIFWVSTAGGVFGFFFDSLLGATLERRGWLNNDAVNFLSTASAAVFALAILALMPHPGVR